jgi:glycosyltransferase involved in cell wall biosynthesis
MTRRIAIDARWIFEDISGIGQYTRELIRGLARLDADVEWLLLFSNPRVASAMKAPAFGLADRPNVRFHDLPYDLFTAANQLRLGADLRRLDVDLYHSANYLIPFAPFPKGRAGRIRCAITLHDLIPLLFPHFTPRAKKTRFHAVFRRVLREAAGRADLILTPSECSRRDVLDRLGAPAGDPDRVRSIPEGVDARYSVDASVRREPGTILFVGRFDPYKNLAGLIRAFARVRSGPCPAARLVVIGRPDPRYPEAQHLARELGVEDAVEWRGYVDGDDLVRAYRQCAAYALLSHYEGFGLPVLEAMACGAPVLCSDRASLPEVAGDAARLVDPDDLDACAAALTAVLTDDALAADLSRRGMERAASFTWDRTARETLTAFEHLLRQGA